MDGVRAEHELEDMVANLGRELEEAGLGAVLLIDCLEVCEDCRG